MTAKISSENFLEFLSSFLTFFFSRSVKNARKKLWKKKVSIFAGTAARFRRNAKWFRRLHERGTLNFLSAKVIKFRLENEIRLPFFSHLRFDSRPPFSFQHIYYIHSPTFHTKETETKNLRYIEIAKVSHRRSTSTPVEFQIAHFCIQKSFLL